MHNKKMATGAGDISLPDVSKLNDLKDDQIEALIEKLAEVQAHAPQIIAALEAQQEARSRGSRGSGENRKTKNRGHSPTRQSPPQQQKHIVEEEEEEDDDEDYDDFDEEAEYPMVGDGYSDEISVVSDMTTPTVVSSLEINEEEYYKDMVVGGMKLNAPKKKDLLSQVARTNARKMPGAAIPKKKIVPPTDGALKKPARATSANQAAGAPAAPAARKKKPKEGTTSGGKTPTGTRKVKKKIVKKATPPSNGATGWEAANGSTSATAKKKGPQEKGPVMIDDDGFLVDQSTFETFDSSNNPFAAVPSFSTDGSNANTFDAFADFGPPAPAPKKSSTKPKKLNAASSGKKKSSGAAPTSPKQKRKGTRRASVGIS